MCFFFIVAEIVCWSNCLALLSSGWQGWLIMMKFLLFFLFFKIIPRGSKISWGRQEKPIEKSRIYWQPLRAGPIRQCPGWGMTEREIWILKCLQETRTFLFAVGWGWRGGTCLFVFFVFFLSCSFFIISFFRSLFFPLSLFVYWFSSIFYLHTPLSSLCFLILSTLPLSFPLLSSSLLCTPFVSSPLRSSATLNVRVCTSLFTFQKAFSIMCICYILYVGRRTAREKGREENRREKDGRE